MTLSLNPYQEMASIIARFAKTDEERSTAIDGLFFSRRSSPTHCLHTAQWPCFALVAQGAKSLKLGSDVYRYGVGDFLVVSIDLPVVSQVTDASIEEPNLGIGLRIDPDQLKAVLARLGLNQPSVTPGDMRAVSVNKASPDLLDAVLRLLRLLERPEDIPAVAPLFEQEILYRLLTGPFGPQLVQIAMSETPGNRIAQATAWLRDNFARPLRIEELAGRVGMSVSSLHHHFKAVTAMTPMQYQKQLRLHEARRLILVEHVDVGTAGYNVGYQSPSQFSREYTRLYGAPPLKDINTFKISQPLPSG
ncbi:AraC family transcriptional regulator [Phyllobacterium myrsinacearum]|uniref:AraC-like DNA-binding protein n=1 Tax=Phyllobacterium myrsinacearum TaxID=28101 RepID=A0A839EUR6_9HYPH|nr:AraC family transcriptional regulator [Phyllobacterium myrsinacearum]MBA8881244.1 AraC-like DNA-binding protein [Phyllobacterium myrsinacearum]